MSVAAINSGQIIQRRIIRMSGQQNILDAFTNTLNPNFTIAPFVPGTRLMFISAAIYARCVAPTELHINSDGGIHFSSGVILNQIASNAGWQLFPDQTTQVAMQGQVNTSMLWFLDSFNVADMPTVLAIDCYYYRINYNSLL